MLKLGMTITLDKMIDQLLEQKFPGHERPDKNNQLTTAEQLKAPDHFIEKFGVYVERKSINPASRDLIARVNKHDRYN